MAVVIRMKRTGRRNRPCYRISVADNRFPRDGRTLETLGLYDPVASRDQHTLDVERARFWLRAGALPSPTVHSLFKRYDVYQDDLVLGVHKKRDRSGRKKVTRTGERKRAAKTERASAKKARHGERVVARRAAKRAAAAGVDAGSGS